MALSVVSPRPGNVYRLGEAPEFRVSSSAPLQGRLSLRVLDLRAAEHYRLELPLSPGWEPVVTLPALPQGWYGLTWSLAAEGEESPLSGQVSFAVVPEPPAGGSPRVHVDAAAAALVPESRFEDVAEIARLTGAGHLRERLLWEALEPEPGRFVQALRYDRAVAALAATGRPVLLGISALPGWASLGPPSAPWRGYTPPADVTDVYRFFREASARYAGQVDAWEIWNEPELSFFYGRPEELAAIQKAGYLGVKAGNPSAQVLLPGFAAQPGLYLERFLRGGVADYFDVYNLHYYTPVQELWSFVSAHQAVLREYAPGKPLWLTEVGADPTATPLEQCVHTWQALPLALVAGADQVFSFILPHLEEVPGRAFGLLNPDLTPRPAYAALAALTDVLGEATPLGFLELPRGGLGLVFDTGREHAMVAWTGGVESLSLEADSVEVVNLVGVRGRVPSRSGTVRLALSPEPVALLGVPESLPGRFTPVAAPTRYPVGRPGDPVWTALRFREPWLDLPRQREAFPARPSDRLEVEVRAGNHSPRPARVRLELEVPSGWSTDSGGAWQILLAPQESALRVTAVTVPASVESGDHSVRVRAFSEGRELAPSLGWVRIA